MTRAVTEEEFLEWARHPVTLAMRQVLASKRADLRNEWEQSDPTAFLRDELVVANVANIGWCRGLAFAETIDYEQYLTEIDDGEQVGAQSSGSGGAS